MITIPNSLIVLPENEPIFTENAIHVSIEDEAAGVFVCVRQFSNSGTELEIRITQEEWPEIREAINKMIRLCEKLNKEREDKNE